MKLLLAVLCTLALLQGSYAKVVPQQAEPEARGLISGILGLGGDIIDFGLNTISAVTSAALNAISTTANNLGKLADSAIKRVDVVVQDLLDLPIEILEPAVKLFRGAVQVPVNAAKSLADALKLSDARKGADAIMQGLEKMIAAANNSINEVAKVNPAEAAAMQQRLAELQELANRIRANVEKAAEAASSGLFRKSLEKVLGDQNLNNLRGIIEYGAALINNATVSYMDAIKKAPYLPLLNEILHATSPSVVTKALQDARNMIRQVIRNATMAANQQATKVITDINTFSSEYAKNVSDVLAKVTAAYMLQSQELGEAARADLQEAWQKLTQAIQGAQSQANMLAQNVSMQVSGAISEAAARVDAKIDEVMANLATMGQNGIAAVSKLVNVAKEGSAKIANCTLDTAMASRDVLLPYIPKIIGAIVIQPLTAALMRDLANDAPKFVEMAVDVATCVHEQSQAVQNETSNVASR